MDWCLTTIVAGNFLQPTKLMSEPALRFPKKVLGGIGLLRQDGVARASERGIVPTAEMRAPRFTLTENRTTCGGAILKNTGDSSMAALLVFGGVHLPEDACT